MKKAKIMLTAIAVFAVVGGALAFKARTNINVYRLNAQGTACPKLAGVYTATPTAPFISSVYTTTANPGASVPTSLCTSTIRLAAE